MKNLCAFGLAAFMFLACDFDKVPPANNCNLGINLDLPRGKIVTALKTKIDSLDTFIAEKKKKEPAFNFWMCDNFRTELIKLNQDFAGLPALSETVNGFNHVEAVLKNTLRDYGVDHYMGVAESFCRDQHMNLIATYSSPTNESYQEKRLVQYNKKPHYDTESDIFVTTYKGYKHVDVCPTEIYVAFCLREKQPANPIDLSRLKSLYPDEKVIIEGVFDGFRSKSEKTDVGQGVSRPEVLCAYLKDWTIISPKNDRQ
jgi:hypothetical protein